MGLALISYNGWCAINSNQPTNQPTKQTNKHRKLMIKLTKYEYSFVWEWSKVLAFQNLQEKMCKAHDHYSKDGCQIGWGCRIHRLHLCRKVRHPERASLYDTKQSNGEVSVMQELWGMQSTSSLSSLPG